MFDLMSIIFILIILLVGIIGYFKGFFSLLLSIAKGLVASLIASFLCNPLGSLLYSTGLGDTISNKVDASLVAQNEVYKMEITSDIEESIVNGYINDGINGLSLPGVIKNCVRDITNDIDFVAEGETKTVGRILGDSIADFICTTIAFIILVIALFIVLSLLQRLFRNINFIPVVGPLNRILGGLLGIFLAFMVIGLCCYIISFVITLPGDFPAKLKDIIGLTPGAEKDTFARFCYDYNVLRWVYHLIF